MVRCGGRTGQSRAVDFSGAHEPSPMKEQRGRNPWISAPWWLVIRAEIFTSARFRGTVCFWHAPYPSLVPLPMLCPCCALCLMLCAHVVPCCAMPPSAHSPERIPSCASLSCCTSGVLPLGTPSSKHSLELGSSLCSSLLLLPPC